MCFASLHQAYTNIVHWLPKLKFENTTKMSIHCRSELWISPGISYLLNCLPHTVDQSRVTQLARPQDSWSRCHWAASALGTGTLADNTNTEHLISYIENISLLFPAIQLTCQGWRCCGSVQTPLPCSHDTRSCRAWATLYTAVYAISTSLTSWKGNSWPLRLSAPVHSRTSSVSVLFSCGHLHPKVASQNLTRNTSSGIWLGWRLEKNSGNPCTWLLWHRRPNAPCRIWEMPGVARASAVCRRPSLTQTWPRGWKPRRLCRMSLKLELFRKTRTPVAVLVCIFCTTQVIFSRECWEGTVRWNSMQMPAFSNSLAARAPACCPNSSSWARMMTQDHPKLSTSWITAREDTKSLAWVRRKEGNWVLSLRLGSVDEWLTCGGEQGTGERTRAQIQIFHRLKLRMQIQWGQAAQDSSPREAAYPPRAVPLRTVSHDHVCSWTAKQLCTQARSELRHYCSFGNLKARHRWAVWVTTQIQLCCLKRHTSSWRIHRD